MATIQTSIRIYDGMTPALRGDYMDTAAFVSQLGIRSGDAFKDNKETSLLPISLTSSLSLPAHLRTRCGSHPTRVCGLK